MCTMHPPNLAGYLAEATARGLPAFTTLSANVLNHAEFTQRVAGARQILRLHLGVVARKDNALRAAFERGFHRPRHTIRRAMGLTRAHRHVNVHARPDLYRMTGHGFDGTAGFAFHVIRR